jgi:hypothetical protein
MNSKLYDLVIEAYWNAIMNGDKLNDWTAEEVALDMCEYDADIEPYPLEEVIAAVEQFRKNK